ncbi:hypothetical protein ACFL5Q_06955, partial [Planctomycetota bacterium]
MRHSSWRRAVRGNGKKTRLSGGKPARRAAWSARRLGLFEPLESRRLLTVALLDTAACNGIAVDSAIANIGDKATPSVHIAEGADMSAVEGWITAAYQVILTSQPTHDVQVLLAPDAQVSVDPVGPLVFTPADWNSYQTVTVLAVDDDVIEGPHTGTIVHTASSADPVYDGIAVESVTVQIGDDDIAEYGDAPAPYPT